MVDCGLELEVWYCTKHGITESYDREFGRMIKWDLDLLAGYKYKFLWNPFGKGPYGFFHIFNPGVLIRLFRTSTSTIVIHGWQFSTNWLIVLFAKLFGHRVALKTETPINQVHDITSLKYRFLSNCFIKKIDEFHYIGERNMLFYKELGVCHNKLVFTPYSVDNDRFQRDYHKNLPKRAALRQKFQIPLSSTLFVISGKLIPKKRPLDVLEAITLLDNKVKESSHFIFVGDGQLHSEMLEYVKSSSLTNVTFSGFVNQSQIGKCYTIADCYIMASGHGETWGLSTNEALNYKLPVIISETIGCTSDLVRDNGYTFSCGNPQELAEAITNFIYQPSEKKIEMGHKSGQIIEKYSYDTIVQNLTKHKHRTTLR